MDELTEPLKMREGEPWWEFAERKWAQAQKLFVEGVFAVASGEALLVKGGPEWLEVQHGDRSVRLSRCGDNFVFAAGVIPGSWRSDASMWRYLSGWERRLSARALELAEWIVGAGPVPAVPREPIGGNYAHAGDSNFLRMND